MLACLACGMAALLGLPGLALADPSWRLEQPEPPAGVTFKVPLGAPGDLKFWAPNRGLLAVEGNAVIPRGLFVWNGSVWRQLSTVCGGSGDTTRIAWAGPTEFWVITTPSLPRVGSGNALCHFKDGEVVGSYSTAAQSADPYRQMTSAACLSPSDCWFGGVGSRDPTGERAGSFHLHWDGTTLASFYGPQGRGVSDLQSFGGQIIESTFVGPRAEGDGEVELAEPEAGSPSLLHRIVAGVFSNDPFLPAPIVGVADDGSELLALDSDGTQLWAAGGGAASGPAPAPGESVARPPLILRMDPVTGVFMTVPISPSQFGGTDRVVDIAAVPGGSSALAAVVGFAQRRATNIKATVALVAADGTVTIDRLPSSGAGRGAAARVACPAANDCWMVTTAGWLFHWSDATAQPIDIEPAFQTVITFRPNEAAEQFVPDTPPADDSQLFAPPVVEQRPVVRPPAKAIRLPAVMRNVKSRLKGTTLTLSFRLVRKAKVALIAYRGSKTVAHTPKLLLSPGLRKLVLRLNVKRWPTRLKFDVTEPGRKPATGDDQIVVTT